MSVAPNPVNARSPACSHGRSLVLKFMSGLSDLVTFRRVAEVLGPKVNTALMVRADRTSSMLSPLTSGMVSGMRLLSVAGDWCERDLHHTAAIGDKLDQLIELLTEIGEACIV
jgi:hypothetical protein